MTMLEFEAWVSDNYEELVKLSRSVVGQNGPDVLHNMIEGICEGREKLPPFDIKKMRVGVFAKYLINDRNNANEAEAHRSAALVGFSGSFSVLGDDVFLDTNQGNGRKGDPDQYPSEIGRAIRARKDRERRAAATTQPAYPVNVEWIDFPRDGVRWRRQQLRDGRLFDERAVRSLAESMHRTSQRYRHFGQAGFSHTEFGTEEVHA